jgi:GH25 family lysozyme M1 (1,4-beta-N-acetylmuramidase)
LEDGAKALSPVELTDWAVAWMRIVGAGLGVDPILYCTLDYLRHHLVDRRGLDHHGLWLAVRQPIEVITPAWLERKLRGLPCTRVEMVQWCSDGRITGYGKKIDRDLMVL